MRFLPLLVWIFANDPPTNAKLIMNKINWRINVHANKSFVLTFRKTKFQINAKTKFLFFFVFFANICDKNIGKKHFSRYLLLHEFFRVKYFHGAWLKRLNWWHKDSPMTKTCKINKRGTNHHASLHTLLFNLLLMCTLFSCFYY